MIVLHIGHTPHIVLSVPDMKEDVSDESWGPRRCRRVLRSRRKEKVRNSTSRLRNVRTTHATSPTLNLKPCTNRTSMVQVLQVPKPTQSVPACCGRILAADVPGFRWRDAV